MANIIQTPINSNLVTEKLHEAIQKLATTLSSKDSSSVAVSINETLMAFGQYFQYLELSEFEPELLTKNDTPRSEAYNANLLGIYTDLKRFYSDLKNLNEVQVASFNFAQILTEELISRAESLASTVLDLNILNNFTRGDVLVAGDDFKNFDYIDTSVGLASSPVDLMFGMNGVTLARTSTEEVTDQNTKIDVIPLSPISSVDGQNGVNSSPTRNNLERFYEGNYYNYLGLARPEGGGDFNFKFVLAQTGVALDPATQQTVTVEGQDPGAFVELGASPQNKEAIRRRMIDGNPVTFWECEYLYKIDNQLVDLGIPTTSSDQQDSQVVTIDLNRAEELAKAYDDIGRDLIVDIILTFSETKRINIASFNPILFGTAAFPEILDVSTASADTGEFVTIDGWNSLRFARVITPEANEFLTDSQAGLLLAPNRGSYRGQGIFPFPTRETKKIKFRIKVDNPVAAPYERIYVLLKNDIETTTTVKTTTKKGIFR